VGQVGAEHGRTCGARGEVDLEIHATLVRVARSAPPPSSVARLELGPPPYDLGTVVQHEPIRRAFPVRSAGTLPPGGFNQINLQFQVYFLWSSF
jgi:hypothetical protein